MVAGNLQFPTSRLAWGLKGPLDTIILQKDPKKRLKVLGDLGQPRKDREQQKHEALSTWENKQRKCRGKRKNKQLQIARLFQDAEAVGHLQEPEQAQIPQEPQQGEGFHFVEVLHEERQSILMKDMAVKWKPKDLRILKPRV